MCNLKIKSWVLYNIKCLTNKLFFEKVEQGFSTIFKVSNHVKKQVWHKFLGKHWAALVILAYLHYNYLTKVHTANPINLDVVCAQWSHFFLEPNFFWKQYKFLLWAHRYDTNSKLGKTWIISKFDKGCKHFSFDIACT